jgi:hypothetical protein
MNGDTTRRDSLDERALTHQFADVRTTIELPDELYRTLKTRAAMSGVTLRELVQGLIERGLKQPDTTATRAGAARTPPPVAIPAQGIPVSLTAGDVRRLVDEEDLERCARSS